MGSYRSVEHAIAKRFEGYANIQMGRPPTSMAEDIPRTRQYDQPVKISTLIHGRRKAVPVFRVDKGGEDASTWPAITYGVDDEDDRPEDWLFTLDGESNRVCRHVGRAFVQNAQTGEVSSGPDLAESYPLPDPITLTYELRIWSLDYDEANELKGIVKSIFPSRGFLDLQFNDGTRRTVDMIRSDGPTFVGGKDPTLDLGDPGARFYSWRILYDIETYEDTTMDVSLKPTIRDRILELNNTNGDQPGELILPDEPGRPPFA